MKYSMDDLFWLVIDPPEPHTSPSGAVRCFTVDQICEKASLRHLEERVRNGLTSKCNPTFFTEREEARLDAVGRLKALQALRAIKRATPSALARADRVTIVDAQGHLLLLATIGDVK